MRFLAFALLLVTCVSALAQAYPAKPIKIVVPFPAGGIADLYGRLLGARLSEPWGQPIVIENRTGAGGNIGADAVAKSAPDGYTLVMGSFGTHAVNVSLFSSMPYDPVRDFAPIVVVLEAEGLLVVHPSVPAQSLLDLIAYARAHPGRVTFASAGMGTASHLAGELFKTMARVEMTHVPYKGNVPAITDLLAGQTSLLFGTMPTVLPHAKAGKLRALATIGTARSTAAPELPTVGETLPGFEANNWDRLLADHRADHAAVHIGVADARRAHHFVDEALDAAMDSDRESIADVAQPLQHLRQLGALVSADMQHRAENLGARQVCERQAKRD